MFLKALTVPTMQKMTNSLLEIICSLQALWIAAVQLLRHFEVMLLKQGVLQK